MREELEAFYHGNIDMMYRAREALPETKLQSTYALLLDEEEYNLGTN